MIHIIYIVLIIVIMLLESHIIDKHKRHIQHCQIHCDHDWNKVLNPDNQLVWHCPRCLKQKPTHHNDHLKNLDDIPTKPNFTPPPSK